jgi:hypothetical protein
MVAPWDWFEDGYWIPKSMDSWVPYLKGNVCTTHAQSSPFVDYLYI